MTTQIKIVNRHGAAIVCVAGVPLAPLGVRRRAIVYMVSARDPTQGNGVMDDMIFVSQFRIH